LLKAHRLYHTILQITNMAVGRIGAAEEIPKRLRQTIVSSTKANSFRQLEKEITTSRQQVSTILDHICSKH